MSISSQSEICKRRVMMNESERFQVIYGKRYRRPERVPYNRDRFEKLESVGIDALEKIHNYSSEISRLMGFKREERFTHGMPQALFELLEIVARDAEGASILAATEFLGRRGYQVGEGDHRD